MTDDTAGDDDDGLPQPSEDETGFDPNAGYSGIFDQLGVNLSVTQDVRAIGEMVSAQLAAQIDELIDVVERYEGELRTIVDSTIILEEPEEYDPDDSEVHPRLRSLLSSQLYDLIVEIEGVEDEFLSRIHRKLVAGYEAYMGSVLTEDGRRVDVAPRPHEAVFVFISLHEALMTWLCIYDDDEAEMADWRAVRYDDEQKLDTLKDAYESSHGLASEDVFRDNLQTFYGHRCFVMHGNPRSRFDIHLATASALFFVLTFQVVLERLEEMDAPSYGEDDDPESTD